MYEAKASGKNCVCVDDGDFDSDDCSVFTAQVNRLDTDCLNDKTLSLTFEDGELTRFKIKGKGRAFRVDDTP